jgi:hypothetical protein
MHEQDPAVASSRDVAQTGIATFRQSGRAPRLYLFSGSDGGCMTPSVQPMGDQTVHGSI